jgi:hypothetical protein
VTPNGSQPSGSLPRIERRPDMTERIAGEAEITLNDDERQPCEIWTRVMGYHRPVSSFNRGKKGEHNERKFFSEARAALG